MKLPIDFYLVNDAEIVAKKLLGKKLCTNINNEFCSGEIIETEAYKGTIDKASHAYNMKRTKRTEVMFKSGGVCYVYLCYGMHHLVNVVTNKKNIPDAVLIRGAFPLDGFDIMKKRQNKKEPNCIGPALLSKAFGIDKSFNSESFLSDKIWIENNKDLNEDEIVASKRVGIDYAEEFKLKSWRFRIKKYMSLYS